MNSKPTSPHDRPSHWAQLNTLWVPCGVEERGGTAPRNFSGFKISFVLVLASWPDAIAQQADPNMPLEPIDKPDPPTGDDLDKA